MHTHIRTHTHNRCAYINAYACVQIRQLNHMKAHKKLGFACRETMDEMTSTDLNSYAEKATRFGVYGLVFRVPNP